MPTESWPDTLLPSTHAVVEHAPAEDASAGSLAAYVQPVDPDSSCDVARDMFARNTSLCVIPVVDTTGVPVGLLNRFRFLERLSTRYGHALSSFKAVRVYMESSPLVLDASTDIDGIGAELVSRGTDSIFDGFVVTRHGRYVGVGTGFGLMRALTERRHAELFRLAHHDILTGLPNRHQFDLSLASALENAASGSGRVALLFIDVDQLKQVNDTFGHRTGDLLLCAMGQRMRLNVRADDIVARLSGDEFAIVLSNVPDPGAAERVAGAILSTCASPLQLDGQEIVVSCSIGVAVFPDDAATADGLVRVADVAAYHAKQVRNTYQRYRAEMARPSTGVTLSFSSLRKAIDRGELSVHYQPQIDLATDEICGVEALVRWSHPVRGPIPTDEMVRLAEDSGMIVAISEYVIRTALTDVATWIAETGLQDLHLAVNISAVQLREGGLLSMLDRLVEETGFAARRLELELTESVAMRMSNSTFATLRALKERQFVLAIDDFGTGYSSLSRLEALPVDVLKIDKSFVQGIGRGDRRGAIANAIIALGHSLDIRLVAEGVETPAQLAALRAQRCDIAQGYLLGRPMPADAMRARLRPRGTPGTAGLGG
jgi:diguanylate cyclase (GGDEF)-like protein